MSKKKVLDSLRVTSPCTEDWDKMTGNAKVRFCSHCSKNVNDISQMTPKEAVRLSRESKGDLCIRYKYDPVTKAPIFASRLHQIARSPIAATGVMAASMALSVTSFAQGEVRTVRQQSSPVTIQAALPVCEGGIKDTNEAVGKLLGTVYDPVGAVVPSVTIAIVNESTQSSTSTSSDEYGYYEVLNLPAGKYTIKTEANGGWQAYTIENVYVSAGREKKVNINLK